MGDWSVPLPSRFRASEQFAFAGRSAEWQVLEEAWERAVKEPVRSSLCRVNRASVRLDLPPSSVVRIRRRRRRAPGAGRRGRRRALPARDRCIRPLVAACRRRCWSPCRQPRRSAGQARAAAAPTDTIRRRFRSAMTSASRSSTPPSISWPEPRRSTRCSLSSTTSTGLTSRRCSSLGTWQGSSGSRHAGRRHVRETDVGRRDALAATLADLRQLRGVNRLALGGLDTTPWSC